MMDSCPLGMLSFFSRLLPDKRSLLREMETSCELPLARQGVLDVALHVDCVDAVDLPRGLGPNGLGTKIGPVRVRPVAFGEMPILKSHQGLM